MNNSYIILKRLFKEHSLLNDINGILSWDMATFMPKNSRFQRKNQINVINQYKKNLFELIKKNDLLNKVEYEKLSTEDKNNFDLMKKKCDYFNYIPFETIQKKSLLSIECEGAWRDALIKSNFNIVKKKLSDLVCVIKHESEILSQYKSISRYDCLLEKYDRSLNTKKLLKIFKDIEEFIHKTLPKIEKKQNIQNLNIKEKTLNEKVQFDLSKILMKGLGFNFSKGRIDKSLHPFCGGGTDDVRITTRFNELDSFSCFDALMHETGHALYEQGLPKKWVHQPLGSSAGMSLHESQSLFIEKQIIKSLPASKYIQKVLLKILKNENLFMDSIDIFNSRTVVKKNYIRVDADEVHYPLHIIHRFNIEMQIIENNGNIKDLPDLWNQEFKKLFGIEVKNDSDGCLQDIHWYGGDFGYYPTYSIGAIIAAQLKYQIKNKLKNFDKLIENGDFRLIILWLKENVHSMGNFYTIDELLKLKTGEKLTTKYFKKHITERYLNRIN